MRIKVLAIEGSANIDLITLATKNLSTADLAAALTTTKLSEQEQIRLLRLKGLTAEEAAATVQTANYAASNATATASTVGLSAASNTLKLTLNGLKAAFLSNPISAIITVALTAITLISRITSAIKQAKEEALQAAKDAAQAYRENVNTLEETKGRLDEITPKFEKLSKGVNRATGEISLSNEEYDEYLEICNEIGEMFPSLIKGYDNQGNAILTLKGNVEELTNAYCEMARAANNSVLAQGATLFNDFKRTEREYKNEDFWGILFDNNKELEPETVKRLDDVLNSDDLEQAILENLPTGTSFAVEVNDALKKAGLKQNPGESGDDFLKRSIQENKGIVQAIVNNYKAQLNDAISEIKTVSNAYINDLFLSEEYGNITPGLKKQIQKTIDGYDFSFYSQFDNVFELYSHLNNLVSDYNTFSSSDVDDKLSIITKNLGDGTSRRRRSSIYDALKKYGLTDDELNIAYTLSFTNKYDSVSELVNEIRGTVEEAEKETSGIEVSVETEANAKYIKNSLSGLWDSEEFKDVQKKIVTLANSANGITENNISDIISDCSSLASVLSIDGMNAQFLAHVLQEQVLNGHGFDLITESALLLNDALDGMKGKFGEATAALQKYKDASSTEKDDNFKAYAEAFSKLNDEFVAGTTNSNQFWAAAELIFGKQQLEIWGYADGIDKIYEAMQKSVGIFEDADTAGSGFLDKLNKIAKNGQVLDKDGNVIASIKKLSDGSFDFDVDALHLDELSEKMGISEEAIISCLEALSKWGDVDYYNIEEVLEAVKEIGLSTDDFKGTAVNVETLTEQLITLGYSNKDIYDLISDLKEIEGISLIDVNSGVDTLTTSLENLGIATEKNGKITIDVDGLSSLAEGIGLTKEKAETLVTKLFAADNVKMTSVDGEINKLDDALKKLDERKFTSVTSETDKITDSANAAATAVENIQTKINALTGKEITITINEKRKTSLLGSIFGYAKGTNNAHGGISLVGEKGEELVQSGDRAYFVGEDGAELVRLKDGDIVYNAEETRRIKSGKHIHGSIPSFSEGGASGKVKTSKKYKSVLPEDDKSSKSSKASNEKDDKKEEKEEKIEAFSWIEIAIDRIERVINKLKRTADSTYKSLKSKLGAAYDEITAVNEKIALQQKAFDRYMQQANSVGLSADLAEKVQNGTIDIEEYDEDTRKLINDYKDWYEKALECSDAIDELHESLAKLYEDNFNNVKADFDNQLDLLEHMTNTYNTGIDMLEAKSYMASENYYRALQNIERQNIAVMNSELIALEQKFAEAMASGEIEEYSEAWYEFQKSINDVKESIDEAEVSLAKFEKTIREIEWSYFDFLEERISKITEESNFLIDLLSNKKSYDDNGNLTNEGLSIMGLHGVNYNVFMAQADDYAEEILKINREIANDPYNVDLIKRKEELIKLQQESIKDAEDEKKAIIDLVEEGIKIEIDSLKELIDTYTDSLDSAKSLYEYQKKISEKTKEIGSIEKQLSAYKNDDSEETRAKVQKLVVDLENKRQDLAESEYEQMISDTKKLLDDLYFQYSEILNLRLDNVDLLISDAIDTINSNASIIADTITSTADSVGYTLTSEMSSIWSNAVNSMDGVIAKYDKDYGNQLTSVNQTLNSIQSMVSSLVAASNREAERTISETTPSSTGSISGGSSSYTPSPSVSQTSQSSNKTSQPKPVRSDKENYGVALAIINGNYGWGAGDVRKKNLAAKGFDYNTVQGIVNKLMKEGYVNSGKWVGRYYGIKDLSPYHYNKYLRGGLIDYTGIAQVDGTPSNPELMLNSKDTENFLELRDLLRAMSLQELRIDSLYNTKTPSLTGINDISSRLSSLDFGASSNINSIGDISITIPIEHIDDYNDFVRQLQSDKQFEKLIKSMTIDRLAGGSSLAKNKYKW